MGQDDNKAIYSTYHDQIIEKRYHSPFVIRRFVHSVLYKEFLDRIPAGSTVIDCGCGEGVVSVMLAKRGCTVTGVDLSQPNIEACVRYAQAEGVSDRTTFLVGDAEHLPVGDKSFDYAISSHVLEHLPDFEKGASELGRVARVQVIAAIPTCVNLCSMVLLGGDKYWTVSRKTIYALPLGFLLVLWAFITGQEGVNEGYAGKSELVHIFRFPRWGKKRLEAGGLRVQSYSASCIPFPYVPLLIPLARLLQRFTAWPVVRNWGYGTTYICVPQEYRNIRISE